MKNILILEDHPETRQWLTEMIHSAFVKPQIQEAASLAQAFLQIKNTVFDLAIVDLNLPDGTGAEFIEKIIQTSPETYVVVATVFDDDEHLFPALEAGAQGYLLKDLSSEEFIESLRGVIKGQPPISPVIARKLIGHFKKSPNPDKSKKAELTLSQRETEILHHIANGLNRSDVASLLDISPNTVSSHLKNIYTKLNISTRAEATLEALRLGLVKPR